MLRELKKRGFSHVNQGKLLHKDKVPLSSWRLLPTTFVFTKLLSEEWERIGRP